jgi:hypothetical protein
MPSYSFFDPNEGSCKLGFVYIFKTEFDDVYKCGFTEASLSERANDHRHKIGPVELFAAVMTLDSKLQEGSLLKEAWFFCDTEKTMKLQKEFHSREVFFLDKCSLVLLLMHLYIDLTRRPFFGCRGLSGGRIAAEKLTIDFNNAIKRNLGPDGSLSIKCHQLDKALKYCSAELLKISRYELKSTHHSCAALDRSRPI